MTAKDTRRHIKSEPDISRTSGTGTAHERRKTRPDASDLAEPEEVWKDGEKTPTGRGGRTEAPGPRGRVADAGDVGGGQTSPYGTEVQADAVARRGVRSGAPRDGKKQGRG